nr:MAG TPA: Protein of unknown function (DUF2584) [Caudoviricetes sp.]
MGYRIYPLNSELLLLQKRLKSLYLKFGMREVQK